MGLDKYEGFVGFCASLASEGVGFKPEEQRGERASESCSGPGASLAKLARGKPAPRAFVRSSEETYRFLKTQNGSRRELEPGSDMPRGAA